MAHRVSSEEWKEHKRRERNRLRRGLGYCYFCVQDDGPNKGKKVKLYPWFDWWVCHPCFTDWST